MTTTQSVTSLAGPVEAFEELARREYKYGFVTDIESDTVAAGPERGRHPLDLGQEERAGLPARVAAEGLSPLARR